jgi:hypothetical protein
MAEGRSNGVAGAPQAMRARDVSLLELLDRILDKGVVIAGDIVISVADIDLIYLGLKVILTSVDTLEKHKAHYALGMGAVASPDGALQRTQE